MSFVKKESIRRDHEKGKQFSFKKSDLLIKIVFKVEANENTVIKETKEEETPSARAEYIQCPNLMYIDFFIHCRKTSIKKSL